MAGLSVGTLVLLDGKRPAEIAVDNGDGSWDCILDDGTDEDGVTSLRITVADIQRVRPDPSADCSSLEAAAASLRLSLTRDPDDDEGDAAAQRHLCSITAESSPGNHDFPTLPTQDAIVWLGDQKAAKMLSWLRQRRITAVLNVSQNLHNWFEHESPALLCATQCILALRASEGVAAP